MSDVADKLEELARLIEEMSDDEFWDMIDKIKLDPEVVNSYKNIEKIILNK